MVTKFVRPFFSPKVYATFNLQNEDQCDEFIIQDLPQDMIEEASEFMIRYYTKEESFQTAAQVTEVTLKEFYRFVFGQKVSIVCFKKGSNEIVGLNALSVKAKGIDTNFKSDDESYKKLREKFAFIHSYYDVFDHHNVNYFVYAHGLAIKTEYRGQGIATELLKARIPFMKAHELSVTSSLFTMLGAQKAAIKAGFFEDLSIPYGLIQDTFKDFDLSNANSEHCKLLTLKI